MFYRDRSGQVENSENSEISETRKFFSEILNPSF